MTTNKMKLEYQGNTKALYMIWIKTVILGILTLGIYFFRGIRNIDEYVILNNISLFSHYRVLHVFVYYVILVSTEAISMPKIQKNSQYDR